ncbi:hypothetical protein J6590_047686 [Homalodisca vitripennis]|nr:hypothetical protein J6590_047686 [Homalodisca vitripennis]
MGRYFLSSLGITRTKKRLEELLESWEEEKSTDPDQKSIDTNVLCSATNGETEPIQVNIFTSESSSQPQPTVSVDSTLVLSSTQLTATGSYESTDLTSPPQLYVLPSTAPQILRGAVANVKKTPQKNKEHRKESARPHGPIKKREELVHSTSWTLLIKSALVTYCF